MNNKTDNRLNLIARAAAKLVLRETEESEDFEFDYEHDLYNATDEQFVKEMRDYY